MNCRTKHSPSTTYHKSTRSGITLMIMSLFFGLGASAAEFTVEMKSLSFSPKILKIQKGDQVKWKNVSYSKHGATGDHFDTGMISPKKFSPPITFNDAGEFTYHCKVHGPSMNGVIQVEAK